MASSIAHTSISVAGFSKTELTNGFSSSRLNDVVSMERNKRVWSINAMGGGEGKARYKGTRMKEKKLTEMIEKKIVQAREACEGDASSVECKVAWDEVEEVSQAKADLRRRIEKEDPLEYFCAENPETDECRIYED